MVSIALIISGLLGILFGIIILVWPKTKNLAIISYLVIVGLIQLMGGFDVF